MSQQKSVAMVKQDQLRKLLNSESQMIQRKAPSSQSQKRFNRKYQNLSQGGYRTFNTTQFPQVKESKNTTQNNFFKSNSNANNNLDNQNSYSNLNTFNSKSGEDDKFISPRCVIKTHKKNESVPNIQLEYQYQRLSGNRLSFGGIASNSNLKKDNNEVTPNQSVNNEELNQSQKMVEMSEQMYKQIQDVYQSNVDLKQNQELMFEKVIQLISYFESAVESGNPTQQEQQMKRLRESIKALMIELGRASTTEIQLTQAKYTMSKQKQEIIQLVRSNEKLYDRFKKTYDDKQRLERVKEEMQQEQIKNLREYNNEKKSNEENKKKIESLEKRIEYILETDFDKHVDGHFQRVITELVQENESFKKTVQRQEKENQKLQESIQNLTGKVNRLTTKLDIMKRKISLKDLEDINQENQQMQQDHEQNNNNNNSEAYKEMLSTLTIPRNLDFRINSMKQEYSYLLNEITEQGSSTFTTQVLGQKKLKTQKEYIMLVTSQFLSFKELGDNLCVMHKNFLGMSNIQDINELMVYVQEKYKHIFLAKRCNLWIKDRHSSYFYSVKQGDKTKEVRALCTKGVFGDVQKFNIAMKQKSTDKEDLVLFINVSDEKHSFQKVNDTICIPLYRDNNMVETIGLKKKKKQQNQLNMQLSQSEGKENQLQITNHNNDNNGYDNQLLCGILEISDSKNQNFSYDEEFYSIILGQQLNYLLTQMSQKRQINVQLKYNDYFYQAFGDFINCENRLQLYIKINEWVSSIFSVVQHRFYFVEQNQTKLVKYDECSKKKIEFPITQGVCGYCARNDEVLCLENIKQSSYFNSKIDVSSILPVYIIPLRLTSSENSNSDICGVIQVIAKKKFKCSLEKDQMFLGSTPIVGIDDSFENALNTFCKFLRKSISLIKE